VQRLILALALSLEGCAASAHSPKPATPIPTTAREFQTQTYDLVCPSQPGPAAYVLVGLDDGQRREDARALARGLAMRGFGVMVPNALDPAALHAGIQAFTPPPGCGQPTAWTGLGLGAGSARIVRALPEARAFVLVDGAGHASLDTSPCSARTEAAGCALCSPRVLLIDSDKGPCRGIASGERWMQSSLAGHGRVRALLRDAHGCDTEAALLRACSGSCDRSARLQAYVSAWLSSSPAAEAPPPPLQDLAAFESRLRNKPAPPSVQFNASTVAGSGYDPVSGWAGALGFRPEFLFLRNSSRAVGVGPYAELALADGRPVAGSGLSLLVPVRGQLAIVPSLGAYARSRSDDGWQSGAIGGVFVGNRTYNEHTHAEFAIGLRADARAPFHALGQLGYSIQLQFDLFNLGWLGFL
jgi:hypothetical protein